MMYHSNTQEYIETSINLFIPSPVFISTCKNIYLSLISINHGYFWMLKVVKIVFIFFFNVTIV